ncbi:MULTISPECIES: sensor histidine kinase [Anaerococcus]|uniref:histidine kinase n=3 Tax=Anaerococcus vaginalis TaxID=33037 RepID=C7HTX5_9FIRM|nr:MULTISPECIES: HAMP domain-containing sensor histidine kinase [Anaerococcus]EEU12755.1 ATPase/histidine kinase/DNA gyrase B/HSP90 domain protein [Anaerococcus vaginalis ATCC 51170]MBS6920321.1 HAMP domain-containing histidine kinase [Anaerococcus vaginalis]MDU0945887.1 HAMP domain-containing sensor histidine kinase [Anaerococcus vaginalis]MDU1030241.1 HAMP domain-containing sensor histidine kinase [Anaerococcus vaginalis]MDU2648745.1 HAMP domain-containing sensor histidine kinase [Anaerococc
MEIEKKKKSLFKINFNSIIFSIMKIIMIFVTLVVVGFEIFSYRSITNYYESALVGAMLNQAKYNQVLYSNYLSRYDLSEIVIGDKNSFYRNNVSQVQILDNSSNVLFDSLGSSKIGTKIKSTDVINANKGEYSYQKIINKKTGEEVIALSYPLSDNQKQIGIIRLISSTAKVKENVNNQMIIFLFFGFTIFLFALVVSFYASKRWIVPIKNLTKVGEKLAQGDFKVKASEDGKNEISELGQTLNYMSENIVKREDMKNEFISSVSHELRTPLTSIKGWAITLQAKEIQKNEDMLNQGLTIIENEGERLSLMVEDLLNFSRLSSTSFQYEKEDLNIVEIAKEVYQQLYPRSLNEKINFDFKTAYEEIIVNCDKNRMKEVFINIIDNAMKFTPKDGHIDIFISKEDENVNIEVKDDGEGIKEDEISFVSSKFFKGSSSKSQTGLGLSICEEIVKAHDGKLVIKSKYTVGTSVIVVLPRAKV